MDWLRTGKITMRSSGAGDYLIMRYIMVPQYMALHGPQTARTTLGRYLTAADAKAACEAHSEAVGEKNPRPE